MAAKRIGLGSGGSDCWNLTAGATLWDCSCKLLACRVHREIQATVRVVDCVWNMMAHAQKPDFVFRRNGRIHLNRRGRQFSRLLAAKLCASAVVMLDTPCSKVVWRVLATHSIRQFPLHFPFRASPCTITFQLASTNADAHNSAASSRLN